MTPDTDMIEDERANPWRYIGVLLFFPVLAALFCLEVSTWETYADLPRRLRSSPFGIWFLAAVIGGTTIWAAAKIVENRAKIERGLLSFLSISIFLVSMAAISVAFAYGGNKAAHIIELEGAKR